MELSEILVLTVKELKLRLVELGLNDDGPKTVLQERLIRHFGFGHREEDTGSEGARRLRTLVDSLVQNILDTRRLP